MTKECEDNFSTILLEKYQKLIDEKINILSEELKTFKASMDDNNQDVVNEVRVKEAKIETEIRKEKEKQCLHLYNEQKNLNNQKMEELKCLKFEKQSVLDLSLADEEYCNNLLRIRLKGLNDVKESIELIKSDNSINKISYKIILIVACINTLLLLFFCLLAWWNGCSNLCTVTTVGFVMIALLYIVLIISIYCLLINNRKCNKDYFEYQKCIFDKLYNQKQKEQNVGDK